MKTNELIDAALDWAVTKIEAERKFFTIYPQYITPYSTDWAQGGPIIEREKITIFQTGKDWMGYIRHDAESFGPTPLIAAMRCYVASKLGDDVTLPPELEQIA